MWNLLTTLVWNWAVQSSSKMKISRWWSKDGQLTAWWILRGSSITKPQGNIFWLITNQATRAGLLFLLRAITLNMSSRGFQAQQRFALKMQSSSWTWAGWLTEMLTPPQLLPHFWFSQVACPFLPIPAICPRVCVVACLKEFWATDREHRLTSDPSISLQRQEPTCPAQRGLESWTIAFKTRRFISLSSMVLEQNRLEINHGLLRNL